MRGLSTLQIAGWLLTTIVAPAILAAYGPELRRLLDSLHRKPHNWLLARRKYKLNLLERLHNSPYNLLLYFMWNVAYVTLSLSGYLFMIGLAKIFKPNLVVSFPAILASGAFGRVFAMNEVIYSLYDYDKTTAKLREKIDSATKGGPMGKSTAEQS
jgi:hypothetical protein